MLPAPASQRSPLPDSRAKAEATGKRTEKVSMFPPLSMETWKLLGSGAAECLGVAKAGQVSSFRGFLP